MGGANMPIPLAIAAIRIVFPQIADRPANLLARLGVKIVTTGSAGPTHAVARN
jgi:hypothetical protein